MPGHSLLVNTHCPQKPDHTESTSSNGRTKNRTALDARRSPRTKRRRSARPDLELVWTKLGDALLDESVETEVGSVALAPSTDQPADIEEQGKHGLDHLQVVETDDPHVAVTHWNVKTVGNRPRDYLGRELLYGSLLRDHRPRWFHNFTKKPPEWMLPLIGHLPDERTHAIAAQHLSLDYLHRRHLLHRMNEQQELGDFADDGECSLLADLWNCTPYGVLVEWNGSGRRKLAPCNHTWFCPWCLARRVVDLYERLQRGPLKQPAGKHLVLGRATVIGNLYGHVDADLNPTEARAIRKYLGGFLQQAIGHLGVTGGLITYQLGPTVRDIDPTNIDRVPGFQHELAVLGEVSFRNAQEERRFLHELQAVNLGNYPGGQDIMIHWLTMPAEQVNALRLLLVGSGPGFDLDRVEWHPLNGDSQQSYIAKKGLSGAFAVQPLFMLDQRQWHFYRLAIEHLHLFDVFGSWRSALSRVEPLRHDPFATDQERAFQVVNGRKRRAVAERRSRLLDLARSFEAQLESPEPQQRGRPARRQQLATLLREHQIEASARDVRWLSQELL